MFMNYFCRSNKVIQYNCVHLFHYLIKPIINGGEREKSP